MTFQYIYFIADNYMKSLTSLMPSRGDDEGKLNKTTSFRLTEEMWDKINALRKQEGGSKDAVIRKLISYGFMLNEEYQLRKRDAAKDIAARGSPAQINKGNR